MPNNNFPPTLCIKLSLLYTNLISTYMHKEVAKAFSPETSTRIMYNLLQHKHSLDIIAGQIRPVLLVSKKLQRECIIVGLSL